MALRSSQLTEGEEVVMTLRTHWKVLVRPVLVLLLTVAVVLLVWWFTRDQSWATVAGVVVGVLAAVAVVLWVVVPVLRWRTEAYVVTTRRIAHRAGILTRTGRDIPLHRVNDVAIEKDVLDRVLGCGTLVVSDATEKAGMVLHDVQAVERVLVELQNLLYRYDDGSDDGEWPPNEPRRR